MSEAKDSPGVIGFPPLMFVTTVMAAALLSWWVPWPMIATTNWLYLTILLALMGVALARWGRRTLLAAGTNVNPALPATAIVNDGPFRFTRNPLYLALSLVYFGITLALNSWWGPVLFVPLGLVMHFGVVRREERYLERKFGDVYRNYCSHVRRYL